MSKLKSFTLPDLPIFHYCSVESFLNIIHTSEFFLSHSKYLNDHMESKWIRTIIAQCEKRLGKKFDGLQIRKIQKTVSSYQAEAYIACFSSHNDQLSQWRSYADNGFGVSIGLDTNKMKKIISNKLKCEAVIYQKDNQILQTIMILEKYIPHESFNIIDYDDDELTRKMSHSYYHLNKNKDNASLPSLWKEISSLTLKEIIQRDTNFQHNETKNIASCIKELLIFSHRLKNPAFHEESEYRLCYLPLLQDKQIDPYTDPLIGPLRHRHSEKRIIPYHSFRFPKDIIKEVVIGPRCKLDEYSIRSLLNNNGYKKVAITRSKASYR